jgi:hypothetical protein
VRLSLRFAATVVAVVSLTVPALTAAADDDPEPSDWPTLVKPVEGGSDQSDPEPASWPSVAKPDIGQAEDPTPPAWPAPVQG